ncbi:MAG: ABC transporter permease [Lachnospiraceae bacterium]|nr:ABC transporter permease [Lachnospiraceae bacterium]
MKKRRRAKKRGSNRISFVILLVLVFTVDNILFSMIHFIDEGFEFLDTRTVRVSVDDFDAVIDEDTWAPLLSWLDEYPELYSYGEELSITVKSELFGKVLAESLIPGALTRYLLTEDPGELGAYEAIIAKSIQVEEEDKASDVSGLYDGEQLVGQTITCRILGEDYEIEIVGCYDNEAAGNTTALYLSEETMRVLVAKEDDLWYEQNMEEIAAMYGEEEYEGQFEEIYEEMYFTTSRGYRIVASEYALVDDLMRTIRSEYDFGVYSRGDLTKSDRTAFYGITVFFNFIMLALIFNAAANMIYVTEHDIRTRRQEFGLLKALGYRERRIRQILLAEILESIATSFAVTAAVCGGIVAGLEIWSNRELGLFWSSLTFVPTAGIVLMTAAVGILAPLVGFLTGAVSLRRLDAAETMKGRAE